MAAQSGRPADCTEEFVLRHENRVYRAAYAVMGNKADAEDVTQDVFLKVLQKPPLFQSPEHEAAWLVRVAVNLCRSRLREAKRARAAPLTEDIAAPGAGGTSEDLAEALRSLPRIYRAAVYLHYYAGYSTKEAAKMMHTKESTFRSLLFRARSKLKDYLTEGE
ncbi:MAG: RNA polymerase sigma factor [Oscillospiraceae bacterium]|jgi:RNA polymerase sigma-70 factor (ECF subfamily)|nr:RNA polymerase sigma factor [Oscillospiraceae bacterium]